MAGQKQTTLKDLSLMGIKRKISYSLLLAATTLLLLLTPNFVSAQAAGASCKPYNPKNATQAMFTPWYKYLGGKTVVSNTGVKKCAIALPKKTSTTTGTTDTDVAQSVSLILIAIVELLIHLSALIAVGYIIYGSFQYILSQGEPEGLGNAKTTIANALVGLVIVILATAIVQFIGRVVQN